MPSSPRLRQKNDSFQGNVTKRGKVNQKKEESNAMSPLLIGFLLFVVVGSAVFQIIQSLQAY